MSLIYTKYSYEMSSDTNRGVCVLCNGVKVLAEPQGSGKYRILQIYSTNPKDFLRKNLFPGTLIVPDQI